MRDTIILALSVALPWIAGALAIRAAVGRSAQPLGVVVGYGYLGGLFAITLIMRALSLVDMRWNVAWIAVPMVLIAVAAYLRLRSLGIASIPHACTADAGDAGRHDPRNLRRAARSHLRASAAARSRSDADPARPDRRLCAMGEQIPRVVRVWWMVPFVPASQWATAYGAMVFTDTHPDYPGTVPLFQVWTALCLGRWDESLVNVPWIAAAVSLGIAFYAQLRRLEISSTMAMFGTYLLLSLPFLTIHVAIAGVADLFVADRLRPGCHRDVAVDADEATKRRRARDPDGAHLRFGQGRGLHLGADARARRHHGAQPSLRIDAGRRRRGNCHSLSRVRDPPSFACSATRCGRASPTSRSSSTSTCSSWTTGISSGTPSSGFWSSVHERSSMRSSRR
jgi:hypothetical protein